MCLIFYYEYCIDLFVNSFAFFAPLRAEVPMARYGLSSDLGYFPGDDAVGSTVGIPYPTEDVFTIYEEVYSVPG